MGLDDCEVCQTRPCKNGGTCTEVAGDRGFICTCSLVSREGPVMTLVTSVHLAFAMRGVVKISAMMVLDASVLLVTLGRGVRKVCC